MTETKKIYREIDILKGVAIAMVLLGHSIIEFPIDLSQVSWCFFLHVFVSSAHMPLFFAISGYCFSFHGWGDYLRKKCRRILIPYLVFSVLGVLMKTLFPSVVNGSVSLSRLAFSILTGGQHWFLYALFVIFLFFPLVSRFFEKGGPAAWIVLALACLLQLFPFWPTLFDIDRIVKFFPFFALGYTVRCQIRCEPDTGKRLLRLVKHPLTLALCLIAWALLTALRVPLENQADAAEEAMKTVGSVLGQSSGAMRFFGIIPAEYGPLFFRLSLVTLAAALAGVPALIGLTLRFCSLRASRLVEIAGKDSLQLYLFNGYLLTITRWLVVTKLHITTPAFVITANFLVIFFFSLAVIELIVRRVKLFRTLTGMV